MSEPPQLLKFVAIENENFLVSLARDRDAFLLHSELQSLYALALVKMEGRDGDEVICQLLMLVHFHFLFSQANLMRGHLSEPFASARAAIDAAIIAAFITEDRSLGPLYVNREGPFKGNFARHVGKLIKQNAPLPHPLIRELVKLQSHISTYAVHADVGTFIHRADIQGVFDHQELVLQYFQMTVDGPRRTIYGLHILRIFVMGLDLFAAFLVKQQACLPASWQTQLHNLGARLEQRFDKAREDLKGQEGF